MICHVKEPITLTNEKRFPGTIDYGLFTKLPGIILADGFLQNSFKLKEEVSYLSWQSKYSKLKTTCHIKPKFSCEINLRELTSYEISVSVATTLMDLPIKGRRMNFPRR